MLQTLMVGGGKEIKSMLKSEKVSPVALVVKNDLFPGSFKFDGCWWKITLGFPEKQFIISEISSRKGELSSETITSKLLNEDLIIELRHLFSSNGRL